MGKDEQAPALLGSIAARSAGPAVRSGTLAAVVSDARHTEFKQIRDAVQAWASAHPNIVGVALVGSWARGSAGFDSDVDVVVLTDSERFAREESWVTDAVGQPGDLIRTGDWGALIERRVRLMSGFDVEFGFVEPSWADVDPIDAGTRQVVTDGCEIWYDPEGRLARLKAAAGSRDRCSSVRTKGTVDPAGATASGRR